MKKLIYILLLISSVCNAQSYEFESIDKRTFEPNWEIRKIVGSVTITDSTVTISTPYNTQVLQIITAQQFLRQDDKFFVCLNESGQGINLRLYCDDKLRKYFELYYYSDIPNEKYFRFCLKRI